MLICWKCNQRRLTQQAVDDFGPDTVCMVCIERDHQDFMAYAHREIKLTCPCGACRKKAWGRATSAKAEGGAA